MTDLEKEIQELIYDADMAYYSDEDIIIADRIRDRLARIKNMIDDTYNIIDIWYQSGCEFPFETKINIGGEEQVVSFDNIRQMLFTIHLLR